jgi:hypothetical protein
MWSLTSLDVVRAKEQAQRRRAELEARYAEERKAIDAECAEIETLERIAAEFARRQTSLTPKAPTEPAAEAVSSEHVVEPVPEAAPFEAAEEQPAPSDNGDRKPSSRWRFQLAHRESAETPA